MTGVNALPAVSSVARALTVAVPPRRRDACDSCYCLHLLLHLVGCTTPSVLDASAGCHPCHDTQLWHSARLCAFGFRLLREKGWERAPTTITPETERVSVAGSAFSVSGTVHLMSRVPGSHAARSSGNRRLRASARTRVEPRRAARARGTLDRHCQLR